MPLVSNAYIFVRDKDSEHTVSKIICVSEASACGRQLFAMTPASTHFQAGEKNKALFTFWSSPALFFSTLFVCEFRSQVLFSIWTQSCLDKNSDH